MAGEYGEVPCTACRPLRSLTHSHHYYSFLVFQALLPRFTSPLPHCRGRSPFKHLGPVDPLASMGHVRQNGTIRDFWRQDLELKPICDVRNCKPNATTGTTSTLPTLCLMELKRPIRPTSHSTIRTVVVYNHAGGDQYAGGRIDANPTRPSAVRQLKHQTVRQPSTTTIRTSRGHDSGIFTKRQPT
jgi:hypothetical protein